MAAARKVKLENIRLHHKMWMATPLEEGILGDGKWQILKAIEETGSLKAACDKLELTYRRTWGDLKKIEQMLGFPLLDKSRGGKEGGMSQLTSQGRKLVAAFDDFHRQVDGVIDDAFAEFKQKLMDLEP
ncbi:MAG: winged helix-turn-helix domain-containing protein [Bacteroidales bacterium]